MNVKYEDLSLVGKVWSLAEVFYAGLCDNKPAYVKSTFRKLEELKLECLSSSNVANESNIENLIDNANIQKQFMLGEDVVGDYIDDESVVSMLWFNSIILSGIKRRVKDDSLLYDDLYNLNRIYDEIKGAWIHDLKARELLSIERRDFFKIKEQIEDLKIKIQKRVERNQINII